MACIRYYYNSTYAYGHTLGFPTVHWLPVILAGDYEITPSTS